MIIDRFYYLTIKICLLRFFIFFSLLSPSREKSFFMTAIFHLRHFFKDTLKTNQVVKMIF